MKAHLWLALVLLVIIRWSTYFDVIFITSDISCMGNTIAQPTDVCVGIHLLRSCRILCLLCG